MAKAEEGTVVSLPELELRTQEVWDEARPHSESQTPTHPTAWGISECPTGAGKLRLRKESILLTSSSSAVKAIG